MTKAELIEIMETYGMTETEFRETFRVTQMVKTRDIEMAENEALDSYAVPYFSMIATDPFVTIDPDTEEETPDAAAHGELATALGRITYARLLYSRLYKTEYTTASPTKLNATIPSDAEVVRQVAAYRRMAMEVFIKWWEAAGNKGPLPNVTHILGDGL